MIRYLVRKERTDLIKNALRKLIGQALINEIDVTEVWTFFCR